MGTEKQKRAVCRAQQRAHDLSPPGREPPAPCRHYQVAVLIAFVPGYLEPWLAAAERDLCAHLAWLCGAREAAADEFVLPSLQFIVGLVGALYRW